jgi:CheY-like chemotaxis protein
MVVEDEALVAMALGELLNEMGYSVIGPFNRISEAIIALRDGRINAAVLDINLGGEVVYPLADILMTDGIPFIFVTGYSEEEIEPRGSDRHSRAPAYGDGSGSAGGSPQHGRLNGFPLTLASRISLER